MSDTTFNQAHSGSGDNVNTKIVIDSPITVMSATTPESLKDLIEKITSAITNRKFEVARDNLDAINRMGGLETDVKDLIKLLEIRCDISEKGTSEIEVRQLNIIMSRSNDSIVKDLSLSILMLVDIDNKGAEAAKQRFEATNVKGPMSKALAYRFFADEDDLQKTYKNKLYTLNEEEVTGLAFGFLRLDKMHESQLVAEYLDENYKSYNSEFTKHYVFSLSLNGRLGGKDYWILSQKEKNVITKLINETISLFNKNSRHDERLFLILFPALVYVHGDNKELFDLCKNNLDKLKAFDKNLVDQVMFLLGDDLVSEDHPLKIYNRTKTDEEYKENIKKEITSKTEVGNAELWLAQNILSEKELASWLDQEIKTKVDSTKLEKALDQLTINLIKKDNDGIATAVKDILEIDLADFEVISSEHIKNLAERLVKNGGSGFACDLVLKLLTGLEDIWASPFVEYALFLLHYNGRYKDLILIANNVNDQDKSIQIFNLIIWVHLNHGSLDEAYKEIIKTPKNNDIQNLTLKVGVLHKIGKSGEVKNELENFDHDLFESPRHGMLEFLNLLLEIDNFKLYEDIVIRWFLQSPEKYYLAISKACLLLINHTRNKEITPTFSYNIRGLEKGIVYSSGNKILTKIISNKSVDENLYIISSDSILAKSFEGKSAGEIIEDGFKTFTINAFVPPFIAIKDLSTRMRDDSNDGSDPFRIYNFTDDSEDIIQQIKKLIPKPTIRDDIFEVDNIPLALKMQYLNKQDPIKAALSLLLNPTSKMKPLAGEGYDIDGDACTDLITIVYMCITSYSEYFIYNNVNLYLLSEDIDFIKGWIDDLDSNRFMTVGTNENGQLFVLTSEDFKTQMSTFCNNIVSIFSLLRPLPVVLDNYDLPFDNNSELISPTYRKSLYAIKNSSYPYLTVDTQNGILFHYLFNIIPANSAKAFDLASKFLSFESKVDGIKLLISTQSPFSLSFKDFFDIASYNEDEKGDLFYSLLKKLKKSYNKSLDLPKFLAEGFSIYLKKIILLNAPISYGDLTYQYLPGGPRVDRIFNVCCDSIINHDVEVAGSSVEEKISRFILGILNFVIGNNSIIGFIDYLVADFVMGRFLDNNKVIHLGKSLLNSEQFSINNTPLNRSLLEM